MKILSIDIETTGVIPSVNEILSIGLVQSEINGDQLVQGVCFNEVFFKRTLTFSKGAYKINKELLDWYFDNSTATNDEDYYNNIANMLFTNMHHMVKDSLIIGKNYDKFDREFLLNAVNKSTVNESDKETLRKLLNRTSYDIGIACMDFSKDSTIPNTEQCMSRLGITVNENIRHHSMYDAYLMTQAFAKLNNLKCFTLDNEIFNDKIVNLVEDN